MSKKVDIYTWTYCPFCIRAKALLDKKGVAYTEYVIDHDKEKLAELKTLTGSGTVPQVFVDDVFMGGCDDIHALEAEGTFDTIFK